MRRVIIKLPDALYADLAEVATKTEDAGYGPAQWAADLVTSELAAGRLAKMPEPRCGARINTEKQPERYCLVLPEKARGCL